MFFAAALVGIITAQPSVHETVMLASTYDEAACADLLDEASHPSEDAEFNDCAERAPSVPFARAVPAVPAVIDCNDARMTVWVGEMIGSCDMPKGDRTILQRAGSRSQDRLCEGFQCAREAPPLRAASREDGGSGPGLVTCLPMLPDPQMAPLASGGPKSPEEVPSPRLERPPRGVF
jgi:hypothetical protein